MITLEVFDPHHDPGVGNGHPITLLSDGRLSGEDWMVESFRRRHPGVSDAQLVDVMAGWSNGWCSIRLVSSS